MKIITLTMNPTIDTSTKVKRILPEKKLRCKTPKFEPGGGGLNVSRAIRNLGGESIAFYTCGGTTGSFINQLLEEEGIDHQPIAVNDTSRENFTATEEETGQQFRFVLPGPKLKKHEWEKVLNEIHSLKNPPEYIVASGSLPPGVPKDFYAEAAKIGKAIGSKVIVDTSGDAIKFAVDEGVFLIKPNINEMKDLMKKDFQNESEIADAAQNLIAHKNTEVVIVSLGSGGALLVTKDSAEHLRAPTVPIKSKVGAGDSTVAGITLHLSKGNDIRDSVLFGIAAGASAVMTPGSELCRKDDTEKLYEYLTSSKGKYADK
jgi:6-phosphofructokinase 2